MALGRHLMGFRLWCRPFLLYMDSNTLASMKARFAADPLLMGRVLMPETFNKPSAGFHQTIVSDYLDEEFSKQCYIAPRGHAKSSIVGALLVLHHIQFAKFRQKTILLVSKTEGHAVGLLDNIKGILSGETERGLFAQVFGTVNHKNARKWGSKSIELPDRTTIIAKGTGQQVVGLKKDYQRPTFIVVDDPEDLNNTKTTEAMEMNLNWLLRQIVPALDSKGKITVIGTPQNEQCIVETLYRMKGEWRSRRWSALNGDGWEQDPSRAVALWPEVKPVSELWAFYKDCDAIGRSSFFYMEYQCVVQGDGDRKFNMNMFRYFKGELVDRGAYRCLTGNYYSQDGVKGNAFIIPVCVQVGIDLASSISTRADWSVMFPWALTWHKELFQLPYDRFREHPMQAADRLAKELQKLNPDYVFIESQNFQVMMRDTLREFHHLNYPGLSRKITYHENKEDRMFNKLQPFYAKKSVYHYYGKCEELENEEIMFPRSRFDDVMDSASTGLFRIHWPEFNANDMRSKENRYYEEHESEIEDDWMVS